MKQYKFDRNYLNLLIKNKDKLLNNDLVILVTYIEILQDKIEAYENMRKEAIECLNNFSVDKSFSFPLMKRWEENQVKSSIDYEFNDTLKKDLLNILNKVGGSDE